MPTFAIKFHYRRVVSCLVEAESEEVIDEFMTENPEFSPLEDAVEVIDSDESEFDPDDEAGDYEVQEIKGVTADWMITNDLELEEIE